jgi:hypothetical protein
VRPSVSEQLVGIRQVLADVIAPQITDAYPADVLAGALDVLDMLAGRWADVPAFLAWDARATADVLRLVDQRVPAWPDDPLDLAVLSAHHREVRGLLEAAMPVILARDDARAAVVRLFRDRFGRYPLTGRPRGGHAAHAAR